MTAETEDTNSSINGKKMAEKTDEKITQYSDGKDIYHVNGKINLFISTLLSYKWIFTFWIFSTRVHFLNYTSESEAFDDDVADYIMKIILFRSIICHGFFGMLEIFYFK